MTKNLKKTGWLTAWISILLLAFGLSGCVKPEQDDLNILRVALEKNQELSLKLANYNRSISDEKTTSFMRENFESRKEILGTLKGADKTEKGALGKIVVEKFLSMENAYCESMGLASLEKQRAYAMGGTGYRRENSADRASENHIMRARSYRAALKASEVNLEQYGWKKTWGRETGERINGTVSTAGKPEYVDGTQWQYLQKFSLKPLVNTEGYYSWIAVLNKDGPTPSALVAFKNVGSETMPVLTERFFCDEKKVVVESAVRVVSGYAFPIDSYNTSFPVLITQGTIEDAAHKIICEKKGWSFSSWFDSLNSK